MKEKKIKYNERKNTWVSNFSKTYKEGRTTEQALLQNFPTLLQHGPRGVKCGMFRAQGCLQSGDQCGKPTAKVVAQPASG